MPKYMGYLAVLEEEVGSADLGRLRLSMQWPEEQSLGRIENSYCRTTLCFFACLWAPLSDSPRHPRHVRATTTSSPRTFSTTFSRRRFLFFFMTLVASFKWSAMLLNTLTALAQFWPSSDCMRNHRNHHRPLRHHLHRLRRRRLYPLHRCFLPRRLLLLPLRGIWEVVPVEAVDLRYIVNFISLNRHCDSSVGLR